MWVNGFIFEWKKKDIVTQRMFFFYFFFALFCYYFLNKAIKLLKFKKNVKSYLRNVFSVISVHTFFSFHLWLYLSAFNLWWYNFFPLPSVLRQSPLYIVTQRMFFFYFFFALFCYYFLNKAIKLLKFKKNVKSYLRNITYMSLSKGYLSYIKSMLYKLVRKRLWTSFYNIKSNVTLPSVLRQSPLY
jgi:hypothetical protein